MGGAQVHGYAEVLAHAHELKDGGQRCVLGELAHQRAVQREHGAGAVEVRRKVERCLARVRLEQRAHDARGHVAERALEARADGGVRDALRKGGAGGGARRALCGRRTRLDRLAPGPVLFGGQLRDEPARASLEVSGADDELKCVRETDACDKSVAKRILGRVSARQIRVMDQLAQSRTLRRARRLWPQQRGAHVSSSV